MADCSEDLWISVSDDGFIKWNGEMVTDTTPNHSLIKLQPYFWFIHSNSMLQLTPCPWLKSINVISESFYHKGNGQNKCMCPNSCPFSSIQCPTSQPAVTRFHCVPEAHGYLDKSHGSLETHADGAEPKLTALTGSDFLQNTQRHLDGSVEHVLTDDSWNINNPVAARDVA